MSIADCRRARAASALPRALSICCVMSFHSGSAGCPADPEWNDITQPMESARGNADAARARRQSAMDIIAKAKPTDYLNPFDKTFENAQKEVEAASALADQHD